MDRLKQDCLAAYPGPTHRLRFRSWTAADGLLAAALWDDGRVTALIGGPFGEQRVREMLEAQLATGREAGVQYWPVFESGSGSLVGCCGLRPKGEGDSRLELGFHIRPEHWEKDSPPRRGWSAPHIRGASTRAGAPICWRENLPVRRAAAASPRTEHRLPSRNRFRCRAAPPRRGARGRKRPARWRNRR